MTESAFDASSSPRLTIRNFRKATQHVKPGDLSTSVSAVSLRAEMDLPPRRDHTDNLGRSGQHDEGQLLHYSPMSLTIVSSSSAVTSAHILKTSSSDSFIRALSLICREVRELGTRAFR